MNYQQRISRVSFLLGIGTLLLSSSLHAQLVADGETLLLDAVTTNISGSITVGTNGSFTSVIVTNGAHVSASTYTYVGYNGTANSNSITVTGPGSSWTGPGSIRSGIATYLGYNGSYNQLTVSNQALLSTHNLSMASASNQLAVLAGAMLASITANIGSAQAASGNTVLISDPGTLWTNWGPFYVGNSGSKNLLIISNGATLFSTNGYVGPTGQSNTVIVTGPGSLWTNSVALSVGTLAPYNNLIVTNGGAVFSGTISMANSTSSNQIVVTGPGSTLVSSGSLAVGHSPQGNDLLVADGATVMANMLTIGLGNSLTLDGGTIIITNPYYAPFPSGAVLGNGNFVGDLLSSGIISPGPGVGHLTVSGAARFFNATTNIMELNAADCTSDRITGMTNLLFGGTLIVSNISGTLAAGNAFRLYDSANFSGSFSSVVPVPARGLKWDTNGLAVDGVLRVLADPTPGPLMTGFRLSGGTLRIAATGGNPNQPCHLTTTTNLLSGPWELAVVNMFDSAGNTIFVPAIPANDPLRFFRIEQ